MKIHYRPLSQICLLILASWLLLLASCATWHPQREPQLYATTNCARQGWDNYFFTDKWGHHIGSHPKRFRYAHQFSNGLACVQEPNERGKWGYVDEALNLVIPYQYDWAGSFGSAGLDEGYAWVKFDLDEENRERQGPLAFGPAMLIDRYGHPASKIYGFMLVGSAQEHGVTLVNNGRDFHGTAGHHTYATDGYWGAINGKGKEVIPCIYEFWISTYINGLNLVRKDGKWGAINDKGKIVVPYIYKGVVYKRDTEEEGITFDSFRDIDDLPNPYDIQITPQTFYFFSTNGEVVHFRHK